MSGRVGLKPGSSEVCTCPSLSTDLVSHVLSFCDASTLIQLLQASAKYFEVSVSKTLAIRRAIHFSFLLQLFPNSILNQSANSTNESRQQQAVAQLLQLAMKQATYNIHLQRLECNNLRNISGQEWLPNLAQLPRLQTLELNGCAALNSHYMCEFLLVCPTTLRHLSLQDCIRLGPPVVNAIAENHPQLETLRLGGCSQKITNCHIFPLLCSLQSLTHLDLQGLGNVSDLSGEFMRILPVSLESVNFSSCKQLRLSGMEALEATQLYLLQQGTNATSDWSNAPTSRHRLYHLVLDAIGTPRIGLCRGSLTYFSLGRRLREVHLAGCEQVQDWEVQALAVTCAGTLTCFQMRACQIGNPSIVALATHCKILAELDVSACFRVGNDGIVAFCESSLIFPTQNNKRRAGVPALRVLKLANLHELTDVAVQAIASLESLHVLDVSGCSKLSSESLGTTILKLPHIVDVNAKGIADDKSASLAAVLRRKLDSQTHCTLRFLNQRQFSSHTESQSCCQVRTYSQRLHQTQPMEVMIHCADCKLLPSNDRGICGACASHCHKGHAVFVGSWTRFYCDCPFAVAGNECKTILQTGQVLPA